MALGEGTRPGMEEVGGVLRLQQGDGVEGCGRPTKEEGDPGVGDLGDRGGRGGVLWRRRGSRSCLVVEVLEEGMTMEKDTAMGGLDVVRHGGIAEGSGGGVDVAVGAMDNAGLGSGMAAVVVI